MVSKLTLRVRELPEFCGGAIFTVKAASDNAFRNLIRRFVSFYHEQLFNDHWGEQVHVQPDNSLAVSMVLMDWTPTKRSKSGAPSSSGSKAPKGPTPL